MRYYKRFYSISHVAKLCSNVIAFEFIVVMSFKIVMFQLLRSKCYANFSFHFDIALYLLIISINIYTNYFVFFVLLIIAWVRYQRRIVKIQVKK